MRIAFALLVTALLAAVGLALAYDAGAYSVPDRPAVYKVVRLYDDDGGALVVTLYEDGTGAWREE